ncbi:MAG: bile acid:sodium symporter family protein [Planctomycetia bacterium]|nr:bile acid:sodium symporter family protein [Planctomycetia bacterium]
MKFLISHFMKRIGLDLFILLLFFVILLAWINPLPGSSQDLFSLHTLATWGVSAIFFFYGLRLDRKKIYHGISDFRLHLLIQLTTFLLFPLLVLPFMSFFGHNADGNPDTLWLGIFFLAALPSTVSSSVVMVNIARGNVTAAIFNASISSLLGVFLTPLWMHLWLFTSAEVPLTSILFSLIIQVIVPILAGMFLHHSLGWFAIKYDKTLKKMDQGIILLIIYTSFCHSFSENMFAGFTFLRLLTLIAGMLSLFLTIYTLISFFCRLFHFKKKDRITALFCGSKKSLVHGTVMSRVILHDPSLAGILLMPTMIYHAMQLILISVIASKMLSDTPYSDEISAE